MSIAEEKSNSIRHLSTSNQKRVSYWKLIGYPRFTFAAFARAMQGFNFCHQEPLLATRLVEKSLSVMQIGFFFSIYSIVGLPVSLLVKYVPKRIERRVTLLLSFLLSSFAFLCVGPSELLHFPDSLLLMGIGQFLAGLTYTLVICIQLPEMVDGVIDEFPGQEREVNNLSSAICLLISAVGQFLAPIYGSYFEERIGFKNTTTMTAFLNVAFAVAYFATAGGPSAFTKTY